MSPEMEPSVSLSKSTSASLPMIPGPPTRHIKLVPDIVVPADAITIEGTTTRFSAAVAEKVARDPVSRIDASDNVEMDDAFPAEHPPAKQPAVDVGNVKMVLGTSTVSEEVEESEPSFDDLADRLPILRRALQATLAEIESFNSLITHYKASKENRATKPDFK